MPAAESRRSLSLIGGAKIARPSNTGASCCRRSCVSVSPQYARVRDASTRPERSTRLTPSAASDCLRASTALTSLSPGAPRQASTNVAGAEPRHDVRCKSMQDSRNFDDARSHPPIFRRSIAFRESMFRAHRPACRAAHAGLRMQVPVVRVANRRKSTCLAPVQRLRPGRSLPSGQTMLSSVCNRKLMHVTMVAARDHTCSPRPQMATAPKFFCLYPPLRYPRAIVSLPPLAVLSCRPRLARLSLDHVCGLAQVVALPFVGDCITVSARRR